MLLPVLTLLFPIALMALMLGMERVERRLFPAAAVRQPEAGAASPPASAPATPYAEESGGDRHLDLATALDN